MQPRTCHDFDDVVLLLSAGHLVEQVSGVRKTVGHAHVKRQVADGDGRLAQPFDRANLGELKLVHAAAAELLGRRPEAWPP